MFERFDDRSAAVVTQAREEARLLGANRLEAEHLLLALARQATSDAGRVLAEAGLDHAGVRRALDTELERSLEAAGIAGPTIASAVAELPLPATAQPRWGASAKEAMKRGLTVAQTRRDRSILPIHLLLGVLASSEGTVPRALDAAGVDGSALAARAEASLNRSG